MKRLAIILPLIFALLSFKVSASVLVFTGSLLGTEAPANQTKENSFHHYSESGAKTSFEEFIEEQEEEEEDSESSPCIHVSFYSFDHSTFGSTRHVKCRKGKRKLFMLYQSYKIDCCKF